VYFRTLSIKGIHVNQSQNEKTEAGLEGQDAVAPSRPVWTRPIVTAVAVADNTGNNSGTGDEGFGSS
jgi:hypothetical protein